VFDPGYRLPLPLHKAASIAVPGIEETKSHRRGKDITQIRIKMGSIKYLE
jgi:hypothetical protein